MSLDFLLESFFTTLHKVSNKLIKYLGLDPNLKINFHTFKTFLILISFLHLTTQFKGLFLAFLGGTGDDLLVGRKRSAIFNKRLHLIQNFTCFNHLPSANFLFLIILFICLELVRSADGC